MRSAFPGRCLLGCCTCRSRCDSAALDQLGHCQCRFCTQLQPMSELFGLDLQGRLIAGIVNPNLVQAASITRRPAVGYDDSVVGALLAPVSRESDLGCHLLELYSSLYGPAMTNLTSAGRENCRVLQTYSSVS